jgi:hypothetical protein
MMHRSLVLFALLCPTLVAQWGAMPVASPPSGRTRPLLAYDLVGNRTLMFGGSWTNEFWSLQNGVWTQLQPAVVPSVRYRANVAVDAMLGNVVLYGGDDTSSRIASDETWHWDGTNWSLQTTNGSPGGFAMHAMAYDSLRQTTVLFGGRHDNWLTHLLSSATWEYANGTWVQAAPTVSPPPLTDSAMCFHPSLQQILLFGGEDNLGFGTDGTWRYDGLTWTQTNLVGVKPPVRAGAQLVQVLNRGSAVLFGGRDPQTMVILNDTWEYDGVNWIQVNNIYGGVYPPRAEFGMTHDIVRDRIVLFGGVIANNSIQNDTWEYGAQFTRFGSGCAGAAGVPSLTGVALPQLGTTCTVQVDNLHPQASIAMMAVGLSRQQWPLGNLPMLLTGFGMPGCRAYTSTDVLTVIGASGGSATWNWNVPNWSGYLGTPFHLQALSIDPAANTAGLTVSNAATIVVGI